MQQGNVVNMPKKISLKVTIDEANLILEGLGHIPFARVFALVYKLQQQAGQQLDGSPVAGNTETTEEAVVASKG